MMRSFGGAFGLLLVLLPGVFLGQRPSEGQGRIPPTGSISVTQFLPEGCVTDGSISYQLQHVQTVPLVTAGSRDAAGPLFASADTQAVIVEFPAAPPSGKGNVVFNWSVRIANR